MMLFIDFIFVFIRQIVGIDADFKNIAGLENSDIVFKFLLSDSVISVLKGILVISIVLIILFAAFAIVKNEYLAATTGSPNSKKSVLVSTLKSLFMIVLIPILFIGGIFLSNGLLKTLDNVTSGGNDFSFGNRIFIASTYQANAYRRYALNNKQIPITYNFSAVDEDGFFDHATEGTVKELEEAFEAFTNKSGWDRGLTTYLMFLNETYLDLNYVELADKTAFDAGNDNGSGYHAAYDRGLFTKQYEYFNMAEVIDWAVKNNETIYFKTPQDVLESWNGSPGQSEIAKYFAAGSDTEKGSYYQFHIQYANEENPTIYKSYKSNTGVQDESTGSVFIVCTRNEDNRYVPLVDGLNFSTSYSLGQNLIIARGLFDEGGYPTAIREEGNEVKFYRDKLNVPFIVDLLPKISYEKPEGGTTDVLGWISGGFKAITGFDIHEFIPYVYFNFDILNLFNKSYRTVTSFDDGGFKVNYMFNSSGTSFYNFYSYRDTNIIILVFVSSFILGILFKVVFGALARVFDLVLLFITYPVVCASMPLDNGSRFAKWFETVINTILSIYGVVIGINLVMLLHPITDSIEIFTGADFEKLHASQVIPTDWTAGFVNYLIQFMFLLGALAMFRSAIGIIGNLLNKDVDQGSELVDEKGKRMKKSEYSTLTRGEDTIQTASTLLKQTSNIITGKAVMDLGKNVVNTAVGFVPGSAMIGAVFGKDARNNRKMNSEMANSRNDLAAVARSGDLSRTEAQTQRVNDITEKYKSK